MAKQARIPGTRTLYVLPEIRDDDPPARKNAMAVRNACAIEGRCPCCRAVGEFSKDTEFEGVYHWTFRHDAWCVVVADGDAA
jgi:hypothetical protein